MKKIITLALALVMVLAVAVPCFAALTEADGVYTAEGDSQAPYKDDASTHYTIEADFSDLKDVDAGHGGNGCCGFIIGKNNSEGQCLAIYLTGGGTFGWTGYGKWWTHAPAAYTVQGDTWETRFAHIKVEYFNDNGNVTVTATCNDLTINITAEAFETELKAKGLETVEPLTDASHITIVEKINGGQIKNVVYTDLTAPVELEKSNAEWTVEENKSYTSPEHTHDKTFEYYLLGDGETAKVEYTFAANNAQAGVFFGIADCDGDGTLNEAGDQYYYVTVKNDGLVQIERNDKAWGGWAVNETAAALAEGDKVTIEYAAGKITVKFNDEVVKEYTDANPMPGTGYALVAKGVYTFAIPEDATPVEPDKPTGAASIVIAMTALVSLAAVTVVAKKRH